MGGASVSDHGPLLVTGEGLYHHLDGAAALMDSIAALLAEAAAAEEAAA